MKNQKDTVLYIEAGKFLTRFNILLLLKAHNNITIQESYLTIVKATNNKPTAYIKMGKMFLVADTPQCHSFSFVFRCGRRIVFIQ